MTGPTAAEHLDVVVVGSGFGGAVTAYRFAAAGLGVAVLERGRPYPPGSFARTPSELATSLWDPSRGMHGLFDVWSFRDFEAVVSSGLGGGSLIYANVLLRKDERWFVKDAPAGDGYESWPVTRADLDPHYDRVERMLDAQRFPRGAPGYLASRKTDLMLAAGQARGWRTELPPLAVTFGVDGGPPTPGAAIPEPAYGNVHGLPRTTCVMCGECDIGCNAGAKNTLDHTYLSAARHAGADLRTSHEVRGITPLDGGGYRLSYVAHAPGEPVPTAALPERTLTCARLVLAAGTFGTTYLLLRNRAALPGLSRMLGHRFSGNGDLLGFVADAPLPALGSARAPVITAAVRVPDAVDDAGTGGGAGTDAGGAARRGVYVEDAGYPAFAEWLVEASRAPGRASQLAEAALDLVRARVTHRPAHEIGHLLARALGDGRPSGGAMPLLAMGRDYPTGVMSVREDYLQCEHYPAPSKGYFEEAGKVMRELADAMGARFHENPLTLLSRVITVHPLGGAPMGADAGSGVVDAWGQVFGHPGLFVADGAAMPGPVGANPSLTIAACADRLADHALAGAA